MLTINPSPDIYSNVNLSAFPSQELQKQALASRVEVGDLIYFRLNKGYDSVDSWIFLVQKIAKRILGIKTFDNSPRLIHVGIVVEAKDGRILLAEAVSQKGIRIMDILSHKGTLLTEPQNGKYEYDILKSKPECKQVSLKAADLALRIGKKEKYLLKDNETSLLDPTKKNPFSYLSALYGVFVKGDKFTQKAKSRVFKQVSNLREHLNYASNEKGVPCAFNCTYFVSYVLQQAKVDELNTQIPLQKDTETKKQWVKRMVREKGQLLEDNMGNYAINPKAMLPFELYHHLISKNMYYVAERVVPGTA